MLTEPQSLREFHFPQSQRRDYYYRLPSSISIFSALYFDCTRGEQLQLVLSHSTYTDFFLPSLVVLAPSRPCRHRSSPMRATTTTAPTSLCPKWVQHQPRSIFPNSHTRVRHHRNHLSGFPLQTAGGRKTRERCPVAV
jgi:hypothetical protein